MIKIEISLLPHGDEKRALHLGTAIIANDASGDKSIGNYKFSLSKFGRPQAIWKQGCLRGFKRKVFGPWDLLFACLFMALGERVVNVIEDLRKEHGRENVRDGGEMVDQGELP